VLLKIGATLDLLTKRGRTNQTRNTKRDLTHWSVTKMRLGELRAEIQQSAISPYGEKLYPITSDWIPVADVLAIVDRFERELRSQFESAQETGKSQSDQNTKEYLQRILADLLS
jgi:hypothetical protein